MNRIHQTNPAEATGKTRELFDSVQSQLGFVPNLMRVLGNSAALEGYLNFSSVLASGVIPEKLREQIALTVGEINGCGYCLSAHTLIGGKTGLTESEILDARRATAADQKSDAALKFARAVTVQRGHVSDGDIRAARVGGLTDGEIVEIVQHVALNILTNYTNNVAKTVIDFPEVKPGELAPNVAQTCSTEACGCSH